MEDKQFHIDFEEWIITATTEEEVYKKIEKRLCSGEIPRVSSVSED